MKKFLLIFALMLSGAYSAQTQIVAHRGFWKTAPETAQNSLSSFKNAVQAGVYGAEFDVRMSKDGRLIVNHDEDHAGLVIAETTFKDLRKIPLSNGERIPTLREYLKLGKRHPAIQLIMEIKPAKTKELEDELVRKAVAEVNRLRLDKQVQIISFSKNICLETKRIAPQIKVQYLNGELSPQEVKALGLDGIDYHYKIFIDKHPEWIRQANELGLITNSWTVNSEEIARTLMEMGIKVITTDIPEKLKNL